MVEHGKHDLLKGKLRQLLVNTLGALFFWIKFIVIFYITLQKGSIQVKIIFMLKPLSHINR